MTTGQRPHPDIIASTANPAIKRVRSLLRRKTRWQERAFVVEGDRVVADLLAANLPPQLILLRDDADPAPWDATRCPVRVVQSAIFDALTDVVTPQGVIGIFGMRAPSPPPDPTSRPLVVILDAIHDPGNLGTLLRSAGGAGVDHVILAPDCVDPYNAKVVRASMGGVGRVPFSVEDWPAIARIVQPYELIAVADAHGSLVYDEAPLTGAVALIVGSEAHGPGEAARSLASAAVSIPLAGGTESLNAAVAGSLLMFEAARQRRLQRENCRRFGQKLP